MLLEQGHQMSVVKEGLSVPTSFSPMRSKEPDATQTPTAQQPRCETTRLMLAVRDHRDKQAFSSLFDHFAPRLKGFAIRSGVTNGQAEDVVQDVMLSVWNKAHQFDPNRADVSGWIYQIARNRQVDLFRKNSRPVPEELISDDVDTCDAEQIVGLEQEVTALRSALTRLTPSQRELIEQAYLGELSHSEIQLTSGIPLGTIKSRIRLGLEKLRHELKGTTSK
ncbi:sigma-70 family RNA polymerase sigma factor [Shimia aestuarii]|uniref:sigma-70 family RNA polymerase sigma factor n=1 Tax=Shimia aestuarii TaxID=254406 RepID=UPI003D707DDC